MNRKCPACSNIQNKILVFENHFEIPTKNAFYNGYNVVECECGMIFADNIPSIDEFNSYYQAQTKKSSRFAINGYKEPTWYINIHKSTTDWINNHVVLAGKKVLDAGCFSGNLMKQLSDYGADCYGYDPSFIGILISKNIGLNVDQTNSFSSSKFFGIKFDLVILSHVIEHILDHKTFFLDLDNALNDESLIYIEVPDLENFDLSNDPNMMVDQREPMLQFNAEHINFFTKQTLWKMMDQLGYEVVEIEHVVSGVSVLAGLFKRKKSGRLFCFNYLDQCKHVFNQIDILLSEYLSSPVYIWGAGGNTQRNLIHTNIRFMNIIAFIDNDDGYRGGTLIGKPIISPIEISENYPIIICSLLYMQEIASQISDMKLNNKVIKLYESKS